MVTKLKKQTGTELTLSLWDSCPTPLHRAGLAGLWMVLRSLPSCNGEKLAWKLAPEADAITLQWNCTDKEAMTWLLSQAYQRDEKQGVIQLPALGNLSSEDVFTIHQGITSVFYLQPRVVKSRGKKPVVLEIDEKQLELNYKALDYYPHQDLSSLKLYTSKDTFKSHIPIVSWVYPGATELHVALGGKTKLEETPAGLMALAFAPIACSYYRVKSRLKQSKYLWALIVPNVENLEIFAQSRQCLGCQVVGYDHYYASGLSDASLRYLTAIAGSKTAEAQAVKECEVWVFGKVPWSDQTPVTTKQRVSISRELRKQYQICDNHLRGGLKVGKNGSFISISFGREIAAENLVQGKPWYANLHRILSLSTEYVDALTIERLQLHNMKEAMIDQGVVKPNATLFGDVFTWILKSRYGQVSSSTATGKNPNFKRVRTDLQMSIRSVRTQQQFIRWWINLTSNPACRSNPFLIGVDLGEFNKWLRDNWEECLSLAAMAIIAYRDPWKVERTCKLLESKGLTLPEELEALPEPDQGDLEDSEEELETNTEIPEV
jgi:CRISPR-associated protein Cas8a1/Csx13